jgi:transposase-like protein
VAIQRRIFTREFKLAAVERLGSTSLARVARELELNEKVLRRWKKEFQLNPSSVFGKWKRQAPEPRSRS